jgi:hypothetical protein
MVIASNGDAQISVDFENPLESFCQDSRLASYAQAIEQRRPDSDKKSDVYPYFAEGEFFKGLRCRFGFAVDGFGSKETVHEIVPASCENVFWVKQCKQKFFGGWGPRFCRVD